ncbi:acyl-CoA dehydrogenase family protein [Myroides injenensis]|uniref:acyl-CoA dehydrogenase family protein n=1 Tax=Myroides injenensis TaxID=1183151 RepID=UPI002271D460|nr:acyl-CoA dehydrogenase family protein [Myroides injenensis]
MIHISDSDLALLKSETKIGESLGKLTEEQLEVIYRNRLFNMFVPEEYGGHGLNLVEGLLLEEQLARIDGSLGWTITFGAGANMFVGYLDSFLAKMIFQDKKVCFGGSAMLDGIAKEVKDGYIINGSWKHIVGITHSTILTANCHIERDGELLFDDKGAPIYESFFFFPREISIVKDWKTMGLEASGSHSFKVVNLKVNKNRAFVIQSDKRVIDSTMYKFPFAQFAILTLTANHLGMQEHFLEELKRFFDGEIQNQFFKFKDELYYNYLDKFNARREQFYDLAQKAWDEVGSNGVMSEATEEKIDVLCKALVHKGRASILNVMPYLGIYAVTGANEMNKIIRDILTASQFSMLLPDSLE